MTAVAPAAPGQLGEALDPQRLLTYLTDLGAWLTARRGELDELDAGVQSSGHASELTGDVRLGLMLWQAIKTRYDAMLTTWDSGRVGPTERETLSQQIWARLEGPGGAASGGLSVPEACRMSDALTAQLRQRLQIDPSGSAVAVRLRELRATIERLRDQVALEPSESSDAPRAVLAGLASRVEAAGDKASRGGDVGGLLGPLEYESATLERDLIVGGAERRTNAGRVAALTAGRDALAARTPTLKTLVEQVVAAVEPAPKYAVPDVAALGPVPVTGVELDAYEAKLGQVAAAMDFVDKAYQGALDELAGLRAELEAAAGASDDSTLQAMVSVARNVLGKNPVDLTAARTLVKGAAALAASKRVG